MRLAAAACSLLALTLFAVGGSYGEEAGGMKIESRAFMPGGTIPARYTCDGPDVSPPLRITGVPPGAKSLALIVDDPDAPGGTWVHWVVWNIAPDTAAVGEGRAPGGAEQGTNDFGKRGYGGPCPPSGVHRYFFRLYALDARLEPGGKATGADLERAMKGHVLGQAELVGRYGR